MGQGFDLPLKAFAAPGALLPGVQSKIVEVFLFHVFVDQGAAGGLSCGRCRRQQGVLLKNGLRFTCKRLN